MSLRIGDNGTEKFMSSLLGVNVTSDEDYGVFACWVRNTTATFTLQRSGSSLGIYSTLIMVQGRGCYTICGGVYWIRPFNKVWPVYGGSPGGKRMLQVFLR